MAGAIKKTTYTIQSDLPRARNSIPGGQAIVEAPFISPVAVTQIPDGADGYGYIDYTLSINIQEGNREDGSDLQGLRLPMFYGSRGSTQNIRERPDPYVVMIGRRTPVGRINPLN